MLCRASRYVPRVFLLALAASLSAAMSADAQEPPVGWSPPVIVAQTDGEITQTALIADEMGKLHLFFVNQPAEGGRRSVDYTYWDGSEWSEPIDIIVDPNGNDPTFIRVALDPWQTVHMVWASDQTFLHVAAPLSDVGKASVWSAPVAIATGFQDGDLTIGDDGTLYFAYADLPNTGAVRLARSTNGGLLWSEPTQIATVSGGDAAANNVRLTIDGSGHLHAVWTEYTLPRGIPLKGAFYARSEDGGDTWTTPVQVAEEAHGQIGVGTLGDQEIHLVWRSGIGGDGTFHQWSPDGGNTWSVPDRADDHGGFSGLPTFAVDSRGRLHYVIGRGFYTMWDGRRLSPYQDLRVGSTSTGISDGEGAMLAITQGNRLHVVFETDHLYLWHTSKLLDLPPLPTATPALRPTEPTSPTPIPVPSATRGATATPQETAPPSVPDSASQNSFSAASALAASILPSLLLVAVVVLIRSRRR